MCILNDCEICNEVKLWFCRDVGLAVREEGKKRKKWATVVIILSQLALMFF